ncbi:hypothetical protein N7577_07505 [Enterobacter roggenkampii]|uniref:hypothetical protein n=1 Tax=Enterobacter roggenkampii TaxID=1812935 RepID=UPI00244CC417|nr:hypothetical protein [Enterobacter roggenkampii]MDG9878084.1 hypothetical protein [Enterobacter roggenkampii]
MATKQATTTEQEIDFENMSLDELEAFEKAEQEKQKKIQQAKIAKIQASKQEAFDSLIQVVNKYHLTGVDVISTLLNNGKIDFKDLSKIEPVKLLTKQVQKKKKGSDEMVNAEFNFFEGKTIISDKAQAELVCSTGVDSFKATLTEAGKTYLADENKKHVLIDFYNTYKPATATKWDGQ